MRELKERHIPTDLSSEALLALQLCFIDEPLLPNLKTLECLGVPTLSVPSIPLFLSPRVTSISLGFVAPPKAIVASTISSLPTLCPDLHKITLLFLPKDPMITVAVSELLLAINRNNLQKFHVDSPLTEEASKVIFKLSSLCSISVAVGSETSLPSASLPNLTDLVLTCGNNWPRLFHGATFGNLESVVFFHRSKEIGDFLETFKRGALSSSVQNTLSMFNLYTACSWNPHYSSLLPFRQLVDLCIGFSCYNGCSSTVDDDIIVNLSQAMPKLTALRLGGSPCEQLMMGVTAKGLVALAQRCPELYTLRVHFQVATLSARPASPGIGHNTEPTAPWTDCALKEFEAGKILVPEESVLKVALTLLRIFPRIEIIEATDEGWGKVEDAINLSKRIVEVSSKQ